MWKGQLTFEPPMLFTIGFLIVFLFGGITGIILASPPLDFAVSDSYFVVAHFHYVLAGTVLFEMFAGFYFWWPKMTGKMLNSRSEEHTSELQSHLNLVCRLLLEKKKKKI